MLAEWLGHIPVFSWLRAACAFLQRSLAKGKVGWDEEVSQGTMRKLASVEEWFITWVDPGEGNG